jgi:hypothetical protein
MNACEATHVRFYVIWRFAKRRRSEAGLINPSGDFLALPESPSSRPRYSYR